MKRTQILALMTILCAIISVKCLATCDSSFTVTKNCLTTDLLSPDDIAQYEIIITNTGSSKLIFEVDDLAAEPPIDSIIGPFSPTQSYTMTVMITVPECAQIGVDYLLSNTVIVEGFCFDDGSSAGVQIASADCTYRCDCNFQLAGDLDDSCRVDLADYAIMASNWLTDCILTPDDPACIPK